MDTILADSPERANTILGVFRVYCDSFPRNILGIIRETYCHVTFVQRHLLSIFSILNLSPTSSPFSFVAAAAFEHLLFSGCLIASI